MNIFLAGIVNYIYFLVKTRTSKKGVQRPAFSLITPSRGWQRVAKGDMTNWHTLYTAVMADKDVYTQHYPAGRQRLRGWIIISLSHTLPLVLN